MEKFIQMYEKKGVFEIAEKNGVKIIYESWFPTTIGEYHEKTRTIFVNKIALATSPNAETLEKFIIAHELGHFFYRTSDDDEIKKLNEEAFCDNFAREILK